MIQVFFPEITQRLGFLSICFRSRELAQQVQMT